MLIAFLRVSTRLGGDAREAGDRIRDWLQRPPAEIVHPTPRHLDVLLSLVEEVGVAGNVVPDAHLAALAIEHAATIATFDHGFARFKGVRVVVPGD